MLLLIETYHGRFVDGIEAHDGNVKEDGGRFACVCQNESKLKLNDDEIGALHPSFPPSQKTSRADDDGY